MKSALSDTPRVLAMMDLAIAQYEQSKIVSPVDFGHDRCSDPNCDDCVFASLP